MANYKVIQMIVKESWWGKWFVVSDLTSNVLFHDYKYLSMSPVYLLTEGDLEKKQFFIRKPRRNFQGFVG